ncbi:MAG: KEOPS complex N(6)-L-threonylcarbamoyladenine synthase Kae1 [archaeon]
MISLGIESTAHTFGVGIINDKKKILAEEKASLTTKTGGLVPRELTVHHSIKAKEIVEKALKKAKLKMKDIDLISFSQGPGIGQALKVGAISARSLALTYNKPLIGVNHCIAHIEIGKALTKAKDPVTCYVSGANTQIIALKNGRYRIFGETLDLGLGNLLDIFGRELGLGFPAGPKLDKLYFKSKKYLKLPYTVKGMDLAFSGLLTAAKRKIGKEKKADLAYSLLHNSFAMLTEVTERALAHAEKKEVLLTGGVACSKSLQKMLSKMCLERKAKLFVPPLNTCVDNGLMIAWTGLTLFKSGIKTSIKDSEIKPKQRTDEIKVNWN